MKILISGDAHRWQLLQQKHFSQHQVFYFENIADVKDWSQYDWAMDLSLDEEPGRLHYYLMYPELPLLAARVKDSLSSLWPVIGKAREKNVFGANFLPGFIESDLMEVSAALNADTGKLKSLMERLGWAYDIVEDSVGLVRPRVVCMIINEAYMTAGEGTATKEDIDISMKLGTNYPYGPFEWAEKIGIQNVYEVLQAVREATGDNRYLVSEALEQQFFESKK